MNTYDQRVEMVRQMLLTYGQEPDEERIKGYLVVLQPVATESLSGAILAAMSNCKGFPPGPGEILSEHRWRAQHETGEAPRVDMAYRVGPGDARDQLAAVVDGFQHEPELARILKRAKEIRAEGRLVPTDWHRGHILSCIAAAGEPGTTWKIGQVWPGIREQLSEWMRQHEAAGGEAGWWSQECRERRITP